MNIIELQNLSKSFGKVLAVNDLYLTVPKGSIYGFIGSNGSGNTTTLSLLPPFTPTIMMIRLATHVTIPASLNLLNVYISKLNKGWWTYPFAISFCTMMLKANSTAFR